MPRPRKLKCPLINLKEKPFWGPLRFSKFHKLKSMLWELKTFDNINISMELHIILMLITENPPNIITMKVIEIFQKKKHKAGKVYAWHKFWGVFFQDEGAKRKAICTWRRRQGMQRVSKWQMWKWLKTVW